MAMDGVKKWLSDLLDKNIAIILYLNDLYEIDYNWQLVKIDLEYR